MILNAYLAIYIQIFARYLFLVYLIKKKKEMLQTSDNIEASTMTYVFDMFGKSVTQMLQASINQQTAIDELRQQIRSCQTQITNICGTLDEFEENLLIKMQEMRPTIYTRDGVPIDDSLEALQTKIQKLTEKSQSNEESIQRVTSELTDKLDADQFDKISEKASEASEGFTNISLTIQNIQKDLQKQRSETDAMMERTTQLVQLQLKKFGAQASLDSTINTNFEPKKEEEKYVTMETFKRVVLKLQQQQVGMGSQRDDDYDIFDENDLEGTLKKIQKRQSQLDADYLKKKSKLDANLNKVISLLGGPEANEESKEDGNDYDDKDEYGTETGTEFDISSEFEREVLSDEIGDVELRDIGIEANNEVNEADQEPIIGETRTTIRKTDVTLRSLGLTCARDNADDDSQEEDEDDQNKKKKSKKQLMEEAKKQKEIASKGVDGVEVHIDETKLTASIVSQVMTKIEPALVELLGNNGGSGVKLEKSDAKQIVTQLGTLNKLTDDISKLKMLISIKYDKVDAENELAIRITRDEFFSMLITLFPTNATLQKAYANYKKKLPPLKSVTTDKNSREPGSEERHSSFSIHARQVKTAAPPTLIPARNSRLLALNQKFLKGQDGRYYLRDIGTAESSASQNPNLVGAPTRMASVVPEQAFDFQPFVPNSAMKEQVERISVPSQHRARTPPDQND